MLKIRLQRVGKKHDPSFRVVLVDSRRGPKSGNFLEILGNYNAQKGKPVLKGERIKELMAKGAQVSDTVFNLLVGAEVIDAKKKDVLKHTRIEAKLAKKKPAEEEGGKEDGEKTEGAESATEGESAPEATTKEEEKVEEKKEEPKKDEGKMEEGVDKS